MVKSGGGWFGLGNPVRADKAALANALGTKKAALATLDKAIAAEATAMALVERCKTADRELVEARKAVATARGTVKMAQNIVTNAAGHKAAANTRKLANAAAAEKKAIANRAARKTEYEAAAKRSANIRAAGFAQPSPAPLPVNNSDNNEMPRLVNSENNSQGGGKRTTCRRTTCRRKTRKSWW